MVYLKLCDFIFKFLGVIIMYFSPANKLKNLIVLIIKPLVDSRDEGNLPCMCASVSHGSLLEVYGHRLLEVL